MEEYTFCFKINGTFFFFFKGASVKDAKEKAITKCCEADFGLLGNINYDVAGIEDAKGNEILE